MDVSLWVPFTATGSCEKGAAQAPSPFNRLARNARRRWSWRAQRHRRITTTSKIELTSVQNAGTRKLGSLKSYRAASVGTVGYSSWASGVMALGASVSSFGLTRSTYACVGAGNYAAIIPSERHGNEPFDQWVLPSAATAETEDV